MRYGSICSGVEAASLAWAPLGWTPAFLAEVEPFPCALLQQRWDATPPLRPLAVSEAAGDKDRLLRKKWAKEIAALPKTGSVKNLGDFTKIQPEDYDGPIDLLVGGTPCQSFSIAGLRGGLSDPRGNLMLEFTRLAYRTRARWVVWENVPGVLTSGDRGSDFAAFLSLLVGWEVRPPKDGWRKCGIVSNAPGCFGVAWRVLDAQFTRVPEFPGAIPQRRRRVIVVGHLDSWTRAAEVLLGEALRGGDSPPRREPRKAPAGNPATGAPEDCTLRVRCGKPGGGKGALVSAGVSQCLSTANDQTLFQFDEPCWWDGKPVAHTLTTRSIGQRMPDEGQLPCVIEPEPAGGTEAYGTSLDVHVGCPLAKEVSQTLKVTTAPGYHNAVTVAPVAIPIDTMNAGERPSNKSPKCGIGEDGDPAPTLSKGHHHAVCTGDEREAGIVRRLLPVEAERLMGFPDDYTKISWKGKSPEECPDSPRYKACGNSMCVNVMAWVGHRIQENEEQHP